MAHIEDHDGTPVLAHEVGGYRYSFCVKDFAPDHLDWLCEVIAMQMDEIHSRAVKETKKSVKSDIRKALGL